MGRDRGGRDPSHGEGHHLGQDAGADHQGSGRLLVGGLKETAALGSYRIDQPESEPCVAGGIRRQ